MSKAFDTLYRVKLMTILSECIGEENLNIIAILLSNTKLQIKSGKTKGEAFETNVGVPQGDS